MSDEAEQNKRIESLEVRLMHLEAALDELTATLLKQEESSRLQQENIKQLENQISGLQSKQADSVTDEPPPPHY